MPRRIRNWDVAATLWAVEQLGKPFLWGETDCGSLARGMLREMYDEDLALTIRYLSLGGALAAHAAHGGVRGVLEALGALPLAGLAYAGTGDVLIAPPSPDGGPDPFEAVMPVITDKYLLTQPQGVVDAIPLRRAPEDAVAYRVPHAW